MSVFRNLMAVGVSGAITFANVGQGSAAPSPLEAQENLSNSTSVELAGLKQNPAKTPAVAPMGKPQPENAAVSSNGIIPSTTSTQELSKLTFKQDPRKTKSANPAIREPIHSTQPQLSSLFSPDEAVSTPATVELNLKQNLTQKAELSATTATPGIENTQPLAQQLRDQSHLQLEATPDKQNVAKPQVKLPEKPPVSPSQTHQSSVSSSSPAVPVQVPVALETATPNAETELSFSTPAVSNTTNSQIPLTPSQVAQVDRPDIPIPDLTPPTTPFPPPVPNGTLQTNPPEIVLPSANPLYLPTTPDQVEIQETVPLTLQQAVDLAMRNNEEVKVAQLQTEQALAQLREAQADLYPSFILSSSLSRSETALETLSSRARNRQIRVARKNGEPGAEDIRFSVPFGTVSFDNTIQLRYDFGLNGARGARIRSSEDLLRIQELRLETTVEDLRFDVTRAYYDLQEADANVEIQRAAVRNSQKSLEDAEALERAGVGTRFEVLQARVTLANAQQDLTNSLRDQRRARRELAALLNVDENINLVTAEPISLAGAWDMTLEETIIMAYQNRAELQEQLLERSRGEQLRREALSATRPNLTANASYSVVGRTTDDPSYEAVRGWADGYQVGLELNWNFFDGGAAKARARQRSLDVAIAEERFDQTRNQIRLEVERGFYDLQASFENIGTAALGVEEAREALRLARLRFQAGVGTQLEVINQETDLTRAQSRLLNAIIGYNRALSDLQRSVSNLPGSILYDYPLE